MILKYLAFIIGLYLYTPLCRKILKGESKQNALSWILWTILDFIIVASLFVQGGNYLLPIAYTIGSGITSVCIIKTKSCRFTGFDILVAVLVAICILSWYISGPKMATIFSTMAMTTAGIPQLVATFKKPDDTPGWIYFGYSITALMSMVAGKEWTIEERFYPFTAFLYCLSVSIISLKKYVSISETGLQ